MAGRQVSKLEVFDASFGERPTMTKHQIMPSDAVLVAIDIAKARNEVLIEAVGGARHRRLSVMNTRTEHDRLIELLLDYGKKVVCGFEATGNYHRPIAWRLLQAGFDVRLVSSMALARTREALHNGWDKNDPKDAQVILHMLRIGASQHYHDPLLAGINDGQARRWPQSARPRHQVSLGSFAALIGAGRMAERSSPRGPDAEQYPSLVQLDSVLARPLLGSEEGQS
jgi:transposase